MIEECAPDKERKKIWYFYEL
jgi:hypothetical protein